MQEASIYRGKYQEDKTRQWLSQLTCPLTLICLGTIPKSNMCLLVKNLSALCTQLHYHLWMNSYLNSYIDDDSSCKFQYFNFWKFISSIHQLAIRTLIRFVQILYSKVQMHTLPNCHKLMSIALSLYWI